MTEGYSYGANTIRDGVSLTPRRELRALALPSEIMRLPNLEGYLKFPGPFPVASIRLKYVARPKAAERFVPREGDGAAPGEASAARPAEEEIGIPEPAGPDEAGYADRSAGPDLPPEPASWQGELALHPLPGEAGDPEPDAAPGQTADGKAPDADGAAAAQAPQDGAPDTGTGPEAPPRAPMPGTPAGPTGSDMLSIGALTSAAQGARYYEQDGYYAKDDPEHREASAWAGKGAEALGLKGPVDPDTFRAVLEGKVPDGSGTELGRRGKDGEILHRPGRDLTFSAPKSVSIAALVGGDARIVDVHDRAVAASLDWVERSAAETRMKDPDTGRMVRAGNQKIVAATFRHDTSRNLDPQLHTHSVIANMVQGEDGKWRSMANERLYGSKMLLGALYRAELARGLKDLGYGIEKTHADGRFEIAGVPREAIEAFSSRRAEIEAAMEERGLGASGGQPPHRGARGADDAGEEARHRPWRAPGRVAAPGRRSRPRRRRAGRRGGRKIGRAGTGSGARTGLRNRRARRIGTGSDGGTGNRGGQAA